MPFTVSHAAAVLPFKNSRLPLAALMIGSMSPDFAYFLPGGLSRVSSHSLEGIFLFCLPAGLLMWQLFVRILERPTIELLPEAWRGRVSRSDQQLTRRALLLAAIAIIVGAATHIAWDMFTHANTHITSAFPEFRAAVFEYHGRPIRLYFVLQCLSSVVGLLALAIWAFNLRRAAPQARTASESRSRLTNRARIAALVMLIVTSGVAALLSYASHAGARFEHRIFELLIGGMTGGVVAWTAIALLIGQLKRLDHQ